MDSIVDNIHTKRGVELPRFTETSKDDKVWRTVFVSKGNSFSVSNLQNASITYVIKGSLIVSLKVRGESNKKNQYVVSSNELFAMHNEFSYTLSALEQCHLLVCYFYPETLLSEQKLIEGMSLLTTAKPQDPFMTLTANKILKQYLFLIQNYLKDGIDSFYFLNTKKDELFLILFVYYVREELSRFLYFVVAGNIQFKKFVIDNYLQVKNVREFAALANYSTSGFIKKFKKYFNESPYGWMQKQKARQILIDMVGGAKPLQEIAVEYKFSSYQHFANFCKKEFGSPPTEIIKRSNKQ